MSGVDDTQAEMISTEERAEEIVARVASGASQWIRRAAGRTREEAEDIVAEARSLNHRDEPPLP